MTKLIRTLTAFYRKACNLIFWIQIFNLLFAIGIFLLYFSYYPFTPVTDYVPTTWDYFYFTWEKVILLFIFIILYVLIDEFKIKLQTGLLGVFSFVRLVWQIIEWINGTFARGEDVFFILSIFSLLSTMLLMLSPVQELILKCVEKKEKKKIENEIKKDNGASLNTIIL